MPPSPDLIHQQLASYLPSPLSSLRKESKNPLQRPSLWEGQFQDKEETTEIETARAADPRENKLREIIARGKASRTISVGNPARVLQQA